MIIEASSHKKEDKLDIIHSHHYLANSSSRSTKESGDVSSFVRSVQALGLGQGFNRYDPPATGHAGQSTVAGPDHDHQGTGSARDWQVRQPRSEGLTDSAGLIWTMTSRSLPKTMSSCPSATGRLSFYPDVRGFFSHSRK